MQHPDVSNRRRKNLSRSLATAAVACATAAALVLPGAAHAEPEPAPPPPPPPGQGPLLPPPVDPNAPPPPPADPNAPPPDPNAPPPPPPPEPGRVNNAPGGFSYLVPAGWKVSDQTQLSYGQALLTKLPPAGSEQSPTDTSVLLGRLDLKLFAGAETDNAKAAARLASDMGEFFMPFAGTRLNQEAGPLDAAGVPGAFSSYAVKFTDTTKPDGQIWAGVIGAPVPAARHAVSAPPSGGSWSGSAPRLNPSTRARRQHWRSRSGRGRHRHHPSAPPPDPNAPPPDPNAPAPRPGVGVPVPVTNAPPEMLPPG